MPTSKSDDEGRGVLFSTVKGRKGLSPAGGDFGYARRNRYPAKRGTTRMGWLGRTPVRAPGPAGGGGATTTTQYHDHASFDPSEVCQGRGSLFFGQHKLNK